MRTKSADEGFAWPSAGHALCVSVIVLASSLALGQETKAHRDIRVTLCIPYYKGGPCAHGKKAVTYRAGQRIPIKGRVRPGHGGTVRIERRKEKRVWRVVAREDIRARTRYRYVWKTRRRDGDQGRPYKFRVIFPGHDVSRVKKVYVVFFE